MRRLLAALLVAALVIPSFQMPASYVHAGEMQSVETTATEGSEEGQVPEPQDGTVGTEMPDMRLETENTGEPAETEDPVIEAEPEDPDGKMGEEEIDTPGRDQSSDLPAEDETADVQPDAEETGTASGTEESAAPAETENSSAEEAEVQEEPAGEETGDADGDTVDGREPGQTETDPAEYKGTSYVDSYTLELNKSVTLSDTTYVSPHHSNYRDLSITYVWYSEPGGIVRISGSGSTRTATAIGPGKTLVNVNISLSYEYYDSRLKKWMPYYTEEAGDAWWITVLGKDITITFDANGGTVSPKSKIVKSGGTYGNLPTPVWKDHTFGGWYTEKEGGTEVKSTSTVSKNASHTIYAHWIPHYKVTFDPNGGTLSSKQKTKMVVNGQAYGELPTAVRSGYEFYGWYPSETGGQEILSSTIVDLTENQTLYAGWRAIWTISFDANGGRTPISKKTVYNGDSYGSLPVPERVGWTFDGWFTEKEYGTRIEESTKVLLDNHRTLYAHWLRNYTVTFHPMGGEVPVEVKSVVYGRPYGELPEATKGEDGFAGWYTSAKDGIQVTADSVVSAQANHVLYARWKNPYAVTFDPNGGTVDVESKNVVEGYPYGKLPVAAKEGYEFGGWYTEKEKGMLVTEDTIAVSEEEHTLYAHWGKRCIVRFDGNGASGAPPSIEIVSGTAFTLPLVCLEKEMDNFGGWSYAGTVYQPGDSVTVTDDAVLTAVWKGAYEANIGEFITFDLRMPGDYVWYRLNGMGAEKKEYQILFQTFEDISGERMDIKYRIAAPSISVSSERQLQYPYSGEYFTGQKLSSGSYYLRLQAVDENAYGKIDVCVLEKQRIPVHYQIDCEGTIISDEERSETGELIVYKNYGGSLTIGSATFKDTIITFDANGGECDESPRTLSYSFKEWGLYGRPENNYAKDARLPGDVFTGNYPIHLIGKWKQDTRFYTPHPEYYINGEQCYSFMGWYTEREGGTEVVSQSVFTPGSEIHLYAHWEPIRCDVNLDANGGFVSQSSVNLKYGEPYGVLPTPIRRGYIFEGWAFDGSDPETVIDSSTILMTTTEHTLYALWREGESDIPDIPVTVIFETLDHGMAPAAYLNVPAGSTIQPPAEPKEDGYRFQGWYQDAERMVPWDFETDIVWTDMILYAKWTSLRGVGTTDSAGGFYKVSFDTRKHGKAPAAYSRVAEGSRIEEPGEPVAEGYRFLGWYQDAECKAPWDFETDTVWKDMILYAGWARALGQDDGSAGDGSGLEAMEVNDMSFTGSALKPDMRVYSGDTLLKAGKDYTITYKNNVNANKVDAEGGVGASLDDSEGGFNPELPYALITGKGNYTGTLYINFNICPATIADEDNNLLSGFKLKYSENLVAANKAQKMISSFKYKKAMKEGIDYTVSLINADTGEQVSTSSYLPAGESGAYLLTIKGIGNYAGTAEKVIYAAEKKYLMKNAVITLGKDLKTQAYSGSKITLPSAQSNGPDVFTVRIGKTYLAEGVDYEVTYTNNLSVGTATMTVAGLGSYQGVKRATFKIKGSAFSNRNVVIGDNFQGTLTYTGKAITQNDVTLTCDGERLAYGTHYTILYRNNVKNGTATMIFRAIPASGYSGQVQKKFKIAAASLDSGMLQERDIVTEYVPGGAKPKVTLVHNGTTLAEGTSYTLSYSDNKEIGRALIKVTGKGCYTGSFSVPFIITEKRLTDADIKVRPKSMAYKAGRSAAYEPGVQVLHGNATVSAKEYRVEYSGNTNASIEAVLNGGGTERPALTVKAAVGGNYTGSVTLELPVYRMKLTAANTYIEVEPAVYTGKQVAPRVAVWYGDTADALSAIKALKTKKNLTDANIASLKAELQVLEADKDYMLVYGQNLLAGNKKGKVTVVGLGLEYGGSISTGFPIEGKKLRKQGN